MRWYNLLGFSLFVFEMGSGGGSYVTTTTTTTTSKSRLRGRWKFRSEIKGRAGKSLKLCPIMTLFCILYFTFTLNSALIVMM